MNTENKINEKKFFWINNSVRYIDPSEYDAIDNVSFMVDYPRPTHIGE